MVLVCANQFLPTKPSIPCIQFPFLVTPIQKYVFQNSSFTYSKPKTRLKFCCCTSNDDKQQTLEGFSVLASDPPWDSGTVWTTMALYFFSLHIPMSFGGLSVVAQMLNQPNLDPNVKAVSVLVIETLELFGSVLLFQFTAKSDYQPVNFFKRKRQSERNWVLGALLGFVCLVIAIAFTSFLAERSGGAQGVHNQAVKDILSSDIVSQTACTLVYCIVAPVLEEIVYRGFFLTSLAPTMKWHQSVVISSLIFSAAHLSGENFIQLFIIGVVLGCSYCWTGDLRSSILLHSMYNALTLLITYFA